MRLLIMLGALLLGANTAFAACTGSSPTWTSTPDVGSVQTCVNSSVDGDTVNVSAGSATWLTHLTITDKSISLIGAGVGNTIITGASTGAEGCAILATTKATGNTPAGFFRISGFEFSCTTGVPGYAGGAIIAFKGYSHNVRFDHNKVTITGTGGLSGNQSVLGVADHNTFVSAGAGVHMINWMHDNWDGTETPANGWPGEAGDTSWAAADTWGQAGNMYFEDNTFTNTAGNGAQACSDDHGGSRTVYRFSRFIDCNLHTHGTETSGRIRGHRQREIYRNIASMSLPLAQGHPYIINRGSTGIYFDNITTGNFSDGGGTAPIGLISLNTYRRNDTDLVGHPNAGSPWGRCGTKTANVATRTFAGGVVTVTLTFPAGSAYSYRKGQAFSYETISGATPSAYNGTFLTQGLDDAGTQISYSFNAGADPGPFTVLPNMKSPFDGNTDTTGYRCIDQIGAGQSILYHGFQANYLPDINPLSAANNALFPVINSYNKLNGVVQSINNTYGIDNLDIALVDRDYYNPNTGGCTGATCTSGIGRGATLPTGCTPTATNSGPYYWQTTAGSNWNASTTETYSDTPGEDGALYKCTASNTWTLYYTPYTYPHPLATGGGGGGGASPASATITSPAAGSTQTASATFSVSGTAVAGTGSLTQVDVYINGTLTCSDTVTPFTTWTCTATAPATPGTYTLTAKATDGAGQGPASTGVNFTVPSPTSSSSYKSWMR